ncbi:MAG: aspartate/glutamate racemase family protein [Candidatus Levyibacteriota bacterium]
MNSLKTIGILGGMGPQASSYLYQLLIKQSIRQYKAVKNEDFPHILIDSICIPDFISDEKEKKTALEMLKKETRAFNTDEVLCLSIACNTVHEFLPVLQRETPIPFVSMIEKTVKLISSSRIKKIGILATPTTLRSALYTDTLLKEGVTIIKPSAKQALQIERVIRNVIAGKHTAQDALSLFNISFSLHEKGAEGILLGCTELPLVFPKKFPLPVFNSLEILANSLLAKYYGREVEYERTGT